jgi:hypothetical protein
MSPFRGQLRDEDDFDVRVHRVETHEGGLHTPFGMVQGDPDGPSPLPDLRVTWPERQIAIRDVLLRSKKSHRYGQVLLPYLPEFVQQCGGKMPESFEAMKDTAFADNMIDFWADAIKNHGMPADAASLQARSDLRWAFHTEWWEYAGHRVYALDATTAHALLSTDIEDFPAEQFHLPVNSFFLRLPRELGWEVDIRLTKLPQSELNTPMDQHPEPMQKLDGIMVTGETKNGQLDTISIVVSGYTQRQDHAYAAVGMADHLMWVELSMKDTDGNYRTLGEVIRQTLVTEPLPDGSLPTHPENEENLLKLVLGTILYITSAHPHLKAIDPPSPGRLAKARRDPKQAAKLRHRSRYAVTYVGGPHEGFQEQPDEVPVDQLKRKPPRPHQRAGTWRWQRIGPRGGDLVRHTWINPVSIGSWDRIAAWEALKGLRISIGKTRPAEVTDHAQG